MMNCIVYLSMLGPISQDENWPTFRLVRFSENRNKITGTYWCNSLRSSTRQNFYYRLSHQEKKGQVIFLLLLWCPRFLLYPVVINSSFLYLKTIIFGSFMLGLRHNRQLAYSTILCSFPLSGSLCHFKPYLLLASQGKYKRGSLDV